MRTEILFTCFLLVLLLFAGCLADSSPERTPNATQRTDLPFYLQIQYGIIINETAVPGEVSFHTMRNPSGCPAAGQHVSKLKWVVVDSAGELRLGNITLTEPKEQVMRIPLHGQGPWFLIGNRPFCTLLPENYFIGIYDGFAMASVADVTRMVDYTVPDDQAEVTLPWEIPPYTYGIGALGLQESGGGFGWTFTYQGPNGPVAVYESDGFDTEYWYDHAYFPGRHEVTISRNITFLGSGTWTMAEWYFVIPTEVCEYGIHLTDVC